MVQGQGYPNVHATLPTHSQYYWRLFKCTMKIVVNRPSHAYTPSALKMESMFCPESFVTVFYITGCVNPADQNMNLFKKKSVRHCRKIKILCHANSRKIRNEFYFCVSVHRSISQIKHPTWCKTVQILFLQSHSTCFGHQAPIIRSIKKLTLRPLYRCNMVMWWPTCNYNTCTEAEVPVF